MSEFHKYVRTLHVRGSRFQNGDHDLEAVPWEELRGKHLVVEEKLDGANAGISFTEEGELKLQSRGHYLRGGPREKHFALLKQWASAKQEELFCVLGSRYVMYGEWMFAKHTMFYDELPHYFMEFDILDTEDGCNEFLSTPARGKVINGSSSTPRLDTDTIVPVKVIAEGKFDRFEDLQKLITRSNFISDKRVSNFLDAALKAGLLPRHGMFANKEIQEALATGDWDTNMEGLYIKWEEDHVVKGRYKFVRESFTSSILDQETHWHDRPIVQNGLKVGAYENMFK